MDGVEAVGRESFAFPWWTPSFLGGAEYGGVDDIVELRLGVGVG